ncbi:MAG TPA: DUF935 domain-containing protein [Candidatus Binataceae bacterium]|nr:DUF935 domain-containing protein [Candidatus Binataceae bacterium]
MALFDAYGRTIDTSLLKGEQAAPQFLGLRTIQDRNYPSIDLDPIKLNAILRSSDIGDPYLYLELAEEMEEKDNHYLAVLTKRKGATASLDITIDAASDDPEDVAIADFVRRVLLDETELNLRDHIFDILDAVGKGFSATELIWDTEKRLKGDLWWVPRALKWRDPRWFMFDWIGGEQILVRSLNSRGDLDAILRTSNDAPPGSSHFKGSWSWNVQATKIGMQPMTAPLAPWKFITHLGKAKSGIPIRAGMARCIAWTYLFRNLAQKDWAMFTERFGMPLRLGKYNPGATDADKQALLAAVGAFGTDMAGVIPESMSLEFVTPASISGNVTLFGDYLAYLEALVSKVVLGQTLTTQLPRFGGGSHAAAKVHRGVELEVLEGDAKRVEASLNRDLVRPVADLNYGPPSTGRYPKLRLGMPDDEDKVAFVKMIIDLAGSGFEVGENAVRAKLKLPKPEPGEKILTPPTKVTDRIKTPIEDVHEPGDSEGADAPDINSRVAVNRARRPPTRARVGKSPAAMGDEFAERLTAEHWKEVMDPLVEPILAAVREAMSYEDLKHRLDRVAPDMDPKKLKALLTRALFNSNLAGRWSARKK